MATYKIQQGDTLAKVANRFGTDVATLSQLNKIGDPNKILAGANIVVPEIVKQVPASTPTSTTPKITAQSLQQPLQTQVYTPPPANTTSSTEVSTAMTLADIENKQKTNEQKSVQALSRDQISQQILDILGRQAEAPAEAERIRDRADLSDKAEEVTRLENDIRAKKRYYEDKIVEMEKNKGGKFGGALEQDIEAYKQRANKDLADMAIQYQAATGNYQTAYQIAQQQVEDLTKPLESQLNTLKYAYDFLQNDMTESEKLEAQSLIRQREADLDMQRQRELLNYKASIDARGLYSPGLSSQSFGGQSADELKRLSLASTNIAQAAGYTTRPAIDAFNQRYQNALSQGTESAWRFLRNVYANQVLKGTEQENYNNAKSGLEAYKEALKFIESTPNIESGFYKKTTEGLKPVLGKDKDPIYTTLVNLINQAETPIRKKNYGTAITGTEESKAQMSLLNPNDDINTIKLKISQGIVALENGLNRSIQESYGLPYEPVPYPVVTQGSTSQSNKGFFGGILESIKGIFTKPKTGEIYNERDGFIIQ